MVETADKTRQSWFPPLSQPQVLQFSSFKKAEIVRKKIKHCHAFENRVEGFRNIEKGGSAANGYVNESDTNRVNKHFYLVEAKLEITTDHV